jgi:hypothetical protein
MAYELRALVGEMPALEAAAAEAWVASIPLHHCMALVPITNGVFDRLGGGTEFGEAFFLSRGVEQLARRASSIGPIAYLDADLFGGVGTQAAVLWRDGEVVAGPVVTEFGWPAS